KDDTEPKTEDKKAPPTESAKKPEAEKEVEGTAEAQEAKETAAPPPQPQTEQQAEPADAKRKPDGEQPQVAERKHDSAQPQVKGEEQQPESVREGAAAAPAVRRMARELGININEVTGTGPDGRISEADIRNHARSIILNATLQPADVQRDIAALPDFTRWG